MAAPAVAVAGALAAVPLVHDFGSATRTATGQMASARLVYPGQPASAPAQAGASESLKHLRDLPRPARTSSTRHSARPAKPAHHPSHLSHPSSTPHPVRPASHPQKAVVTGAHRALRCSGTGGMLPANYAAIVGFLTAHGYTGLGAAGIAGNIWQESEGNPESVGTGGGGLIGWTPLPPGFVTGNPAADLQTQLNALLTYNQQYPQYIPTLNAATTATEAADIYMNYFERPGIPAAANREAAANAVAQACGL